MLRLRLAAFLTLFCLVLSTMSLKPVTIVKAASITIQSNYEKQEIPPGLTTEAWERILTQIDPTEHKKDQDETYPQTIGSLKTRQIAKLTANDWHDWDQFGNSVSLSGDILAVGAYANDITRGAVYLFERNHGGADAWGQVKKLIADDGTYGDSFGWSVSLNGDCLAVGAPRDELSKGVVYLFERNHGGADAWGQVKKLTAVDGKDSDIFGIAVSLNNDILAVGAPYHDNYQGAVYLFERNNGGVDNWGQIKELTDDSGVVLDIFGIAVSIHSDYLAVSAPRDNNYQGAVYLFERNNGGADNWGQIKKVTAADGTEGDNFGYSVSLSNKTLAVGAPYHDNYQGAVYLFERNNAGMDNWGQAKKITDTNGKANDSFGVSISISGDTLIVGANGNNNDRGAAYLFERNNGGMNAWGQSKLSSDFGESGDNYGYAVALCGNTFVIGSVIDDKRGAAYIYTFEQIGSTEEPIARPTANDGMENDLIGWSVSLNEDRLAVGALGSEYCQGVVYLFDRNSGGADSWGQIKKITANDGETGDNFGFSVSLYGDRLAVGSLLDNSNRGAVYLFERNSGGVDNWGQVKKLTIADGIESNRFGFAVSLDGSRVAVGAIGEENGRGAVYLFERNSGGADNWGQIKKLTSTHRTEFAYFGYAVSLQGNILAIGSNGENNNQGAVYLFERNNGGADAWSQIKKLTINSGSANDYFGSAVALNGDTLAVGADGDKNNLGTTYLFKRNSGGADNWDQIKKLSLDQGVTGDHFGWSLSLSDDVLVVGTHRFDEKQNAIYLYERNNSGADAWGQINKLTATDETTYNYFGRAVSISGNRLSVGAFGGGDSNQGETYIFYLLINSIVYIPLLQK